MPKLERLYGERKQQGFIIYGVSDEDVATERDIARYPAHFLIDRQGNLQPAPPSALSFEQIQSAVDTLLNSGA
jgi:hypothetical protein